MWPFSLSDSVFEVPNADTAKYCGAQVLTIMKRFVLLVCACVCVCVGVCVCLLHLDS